MDLISPTFSDLLEANIEIKQFPDGENYVRILEPVQKGEVRLFHRLYPEEDRMLIQALLMLKTLKEKGAKITLVVPYLPYARQDKIWKEGEAFSAKYICEMLAWAGVERLITFDCHFLKKEGEFEYGNLKIKNISLNKKLIEYAKKEFGKSLLVISPDMGASYMVGSGGKSMEKKRGEYIEGKEVYRKIEEMKVNFEVKGKEVLIIDDMVAGGGTMIKAIENMKKHGASKIYCCATHGLFLKDSLERIKGMCNGVFTSNTILNPVSKVNFLEEIKI